MFNIGNLVVYPTQGVGEIERIDRKEIGGAVCDFYIVRIRANNITLMVPVANAPSVGLRGLSGKEQAEAVMTTLRTDLTQTVNIGQNWNRRFRDYSLKLKSHELAGVAEVLRELLLIGRVKELSFGERRLLEQAMNLVAGELAIVLGITEADLRNELISLYTPPTELASDLDDA